MSGIWNVSMDIPHQSVLFIALEHKMKPLFKRVYKTEYGTLEVPTWNPFRQPNIVEWTREMNLANLPIDVAAGRWIHISLTRELNL